MFRKTYKVIERDITDEEVYQESKICAHDWEVVKSSGKVVMVCRKCGEKKVIK